MKRIYKIFAILMVAVMSVTAVSAAALETEAETLTVSDALDRAIKYSKTLKNLEENKSLADESYSDLVDDIQVAYEHQALLNLSVQLKQTSANIENYKLSDQIERQSIEFSLIKFFNSVINAEHELDLFDVSIGLAKKELDIAEVKSELGLISQSDYDNQKLSYDKMLIERESKQTAIDEAFISLNKVLGADLSKVYKLELDLTYTELSDLNVDNYVNKALAASQSIKTKKSDLDIAKYDLKTYSEILTNSSDTKETKRVKVSQLSRSLDDEKTSVQENIINLFNSVIETENSYKSNLLTLQNMKKQLELKKVEYDLNKITLLEIENYEYQIMQLENTIRSQINSHEILVMQLKNTNI